ncbi:hypothetical protein SteCoe_14701 [Stentor coeruleus]|uniref:Uncharacterized protein n=1 Tax=Stentor coeruleus TaxID=5963 RepID=A0A1R2C5A8_9CILI|nr:hypothetical protein SteCoe_14701 [Stentor coeruleus]
MITADITNLTSKSQELDLTDRHESILYSIQSLKNIYKLSSNEAKNYIQKVYTYKTTKIPMIITSIQDINSKIKSYIIYIEKVKGKSKFTFNLIKCASEQGLGWLEIEGFAENLTLSFNPPTFSYSQNTVGEIYYKVFTSRDNEVGKVMVNYCKKLSKMPCDQIARCKSFVIYENFKNNKVDCSFCLEIELSAKDRIKVLQQKYYDMVGCIEKLRSDSMGGGFRSELKEACCDCAVF